MMGSLSLIQGTMSGKVTTAVKTGSKAVQMVSTDLVCDLQQALTVIRLPL